jgi:WD40 repeat protein
VKVWDLNSGHEERTLSGHGGGVMALALTGDGRVVSGSGDGTVKVWDLESGSCLATVPLDSSPRSLDVKVGADGITLVVGESSGAVSCFRLVLPCEKRSAPTPAMMSNSATHGKRGDS